MDNIIHKEFKAEVEVKEDGTMVAIASTFGNMDLADDIIMEGAFDKTLSERNPKDIKFLYQHDHTRPLGVNAKFEITPQGIVMTSKFALATQLGRESYELAKMGAFGGVSIGFQIPRGKTTFTGDGVREIHEVKLHEVSLVTFPCNPQARIESVKGNSRDFSTLIKEEFGVDRKKADSIYQTIKSLAVEEQPSTQADVKEDVESAEFIKSLEQLAINTKI